MDMGYDPVTRVNGTSIPECVLCTICMDRTWLLIEALESWIRYNVFEYMIIVDWFSSDSVIESVREIYLRMGYSGVYVVRVLDRDIFYITKARNLAMRFMRSEGIRCRYMDNGLPRYSLIIDSDVKLVNYLGPELYCPGGFTTDIRRKHLRGTVLLSTMSFWKVRGYMESITYGHSDNDFYGRLGMSGCLDNSMDMSRYIYHIPHKIHRENNRVIRNPYSRMPIQGGLWSCSGIMEELDVLVYYPDGSMKRKII